MLAPAAAGIVNKNVLASSMGDAAVCFFFFFSLPSPIPRHFLRFSGAGRARREKKKMTRDLSGCTRRAAPRKTLINIMLEETYATHPRRYYRVDQRARTYNTGNISRHLYPATPSLLALTARGGFDIFPSTTLENNGFSFDRLYCGTRACSPKRKTAAAD